MASKTKLKASELDRIYRESKEIDSKLFAEMRSNLLLVAGDHYQKKGSKFWDRIRTNKELTDTQKLRLTKNHVKKITDDIRGFILSHAPSTRVTPANKAEVQDQKDAELNESVLSHYKKQLKIRSKIRKFASDFVNIGEVCAKVFWDNNLGELRGYAPITDERGEVVMAIDSGEPKVETIMTGMPVVERVFGFNLFRDPEVQSMDDSPYLIVTKLVHHDVVRRMTEDTEILTSLTDTKDDEFLVFDTAKNTYTKESEHVLIREHYYRPCKEYLDGYYYIAIKSAIIKDGKLPGGIWPLGYAGYDEIATSARSLSPIKQMRPYQIEINRCASSIATAQITLGEPKLVLKGGARMTKAGSLPGIRAVKITGNQDPMVVQGASGENYFGYMGGQIDELYTIMNMHESDALKDGKLDPYALLYYSMRNKGKFSNPGEKFEEFVVDFTETLLKVVKFYIEDDTLIQIVGKNETVNISEFKNTSPNKYKIEVEAVSGDVDTMLGKQLAINHTLQYVGGTLDKQDIGKMIRAMPFMNQEEAYGDLTINYDNVKNDILSLERGDMPEVNPYDDHGYIVERLVHRIKQSDFRFLDPNIQQAFVQYKAAHEASEKERALALQRAQSGFIPTDGYEAKCDFYETDEKGKTSRSSFPLSSLIWLREQLNAQMGSTMNLEMLSTGALNDMAGQGSANPSQPRGGNPAPIGEYNGN